MSTCFLDRTIIDKLMKMGRPDEESFVREFEEGQQIPWSMVHWIYLRAQAARCRAMVDLHQNVQEMLWVTDVLHRHEHLLWFGLLCYDRLTLDHVTLCYDHTRSQGVAYLHRLWEHFKIPHESYAPVATETPTPELRAEFHPQLVGTGAPVQNAADYARYVHQIKPQAEDDQTGLQTAFANVSSAPTVVYSWDSGAFTTSE